MISAAVIEALKEIVPADKVLLQEPMKLHTTFRIGGPADCLVYLENEEQLCKIQKYLRLVDVPYTVIGNGSNLLVSDQGYAGIVLVVGKHMSRIEVKDCYLEAEAGALMSQVAKAAKEHGLTGLEFAAGIPGTIGGGAVMNAGAYGGEMKDVLLNSEYVSTDGTSGELDNEAMELSYRHSAYENSNLVITAASVRLAPADRNEIKSTMNDILARRKEKQPLEYPSAGSTFKRPEGNFAGALIEQCGLKGVSVGGAQVSEKHAGFIINRGGATAADILSLIKHVQARVKAQTGVSLETEIRLIG